MELVSKPFKETQTDASILESRQAEILITSCPIKGSGIAAVPFLKDEHYLSVPKDHPLSAYQESGIYVKDISMDALPIHYLNQADDSYCLQFLQYFAKNYPEMNIRIYNDYFLYIQKIRSEKIITITTRLARTFRNDGSGRTEIRLLDEGLKMQYYLCFQKEMKPHLKSILDWKSYAEPAE